MFSGYLDGFLRPLQSVTIKGPFPPLQSVAFHGLTTLRLSPQNPPTPPPTLAQLTSVLTACPELRTLALFYCRFDTSSRASIEPVLLPKLELLDLRRAKIDELTALLSCIIPGSNTLTLSIWADPYIPENEMIKLHCFINQFNVKRLYLESYYYAHEERKPLQLLLQTFPALQELALCDYDLNFIPVEHPLSTDRFPRLHTLHVLPSCIIDSDNWHKLVGSSAIRVLYTTLGCPDRETIPKDFPLVKDHDCFSTYGGSNRDFEWPLDRS
ncbi:hypothetical protein FRC09_010362 [Ceratobasidium sp. 395]|nr:hypothetical protein FRC09_010362 [Ceratobasidium sp. 395]